jgi:hypothetical protein
MSALGLALIATATTAAAPVIEVYTFGPGDDIFSHFGHSAICVTEIGRPSVCYNFGTADFSTPVPLTIDFIRGRAMFWVAAVARGPMVASYRRADRTVWRQQVPLGADEARLLADRLAQAVSSSERYYRYHHYLDNCTTRIRDLIDAVTRGKLASSSREDPSGPSLRELTRRGFSGAVPLQVVTELILGRAVDHPVSGWERMFLPIGLMDALHRHFGATPIVEYERRAPVAAGVTWGGRALIAGAGAVLALLGYALRRRVRLGRVLIGIALGLVALFPWTLAIASEFSELRENEVLLVLLPTDLLLGVLSAGAAARYLRLRLGVLVLVAGAGAVGLLAQPLLAPLALAAAPLMVLARLQPAPRL